MQKALPDILVVAETKPNNDFPTQNFIVENCQTPLRRDRNEHEGGLMQFNRKGVVCDRVPALESELVEMICTELNINKKKWAIFAFYRPPISSNIEMFFHKLSSCINNALDKYENVVVIGDINIDGQDRRHPGFENLKEFCDVFGLENLVKVKTFFTRDHSSSIDVILTKSQTEFSEDICFRDWIK